MPRELVGLMGRQGGQTPQWCLEIERDPDQPGVLKWAGFSNVVPANGPFCAAGDLAFYTTEASAETPLGNPIHYQERTYGFPAPNGVVYKKPKRDGDGKFLEWETCPPPGLVIGLVLREGMDHALKCSLSAERVFRKRMPPALEDDGTLQYAGQTWYLQKLTNPDIQRFDITRFAAVFGLTKPEFVQVTDLFDVV